MPRIACLVAVVASALLVGACGGDQASKDKRVGAGVQGSGERELLANPTFRSAVRGIGVDPARRPPSALGRAIGRRMRQVVTDAGRLSPASFSPPYRTTLERRGRLTRGQFTRRYGDGPLELSDRVGRIVALLDVRLDEGAGDPPALARGALAGFGRVASQGEVEPAGAATALRDRINGLFPEAGPRLQCATSFRSSYNFVVGVEKID